MPTEGDDTITGTAGPDTIDGLGGDDAIRTETGDDSLVGGAGDDSLGGGGGDDTLMGGAGNDIIFGSVGVNIASYADAPSAVTVTLKRNDGQTQNTGGAGTDRLWSIDGIIGSDFDDVLDGWRFGALTGGDGDDILVRGFRAFGGDGFDTAYVDGDVDLRDTSRFSSLELVIGGGHVIGDDDDNRIEGAQIIDGGGGDDFLRSDIFGSVLIGGLGDDKLRGGNGLDTASYSDAAAGVTVDLRLTGFQDTGAAGMDRLWEIEALVGSAYNDTLTGNGLRNTITGGGGRDFIFGSEGFDVLKGEAGNDVITGVGGDALTGGDGKDRFVFLSILQTGGTFIRDISALDVIDVSAIDANALEPGDQAFELVGEATGPGQLTVEYDADRNRTVVSLYVDEGGNADATIFLRGDHSGYANFEF